MSEVIVDSLKHSGNSGAANITLGSDGSVTCGSTASLNMPKGTTAQRPTGVDGGIRLNTTTKEPEWYDATTSKWKAFKTGAEVNVE